MIPNSFNRGFATAARAGKRRGMPDSFHRGFAPGARAAAKAVANPPKPTLGNQPGAPAPSPQPKPKPNIVGRPAAPDSVYNQQVDLAERRGRQRLGELDTAERGVKFDFGIDDPTNPFSRANALKRAFLAKYKGASASLAAQGHLYSGAHERALSRTRLEEEQARAQLRQAYEGAINAIGTQRAGVKFDTEQDRIAAFEDWLNRAPAAEDPLSADAASATGGAQAPAAQGPAGGRVTIPQAVAAIQAGQPVPAGPPRSSPAPRVSAPRPGRGRAGIEVGLPGPPPLPARHRSQANTRTARRGPQGNMNQGTGRVTRPRARPRRGR